uniref:Auxin efflux carrier component n=1 Tax=Gossypium raimondii TaxID=29730 RepID=A0A0D2RJQ9_GOSRA|nr:hypothetical protein B456_011G096500 [Gossypium raimondii]
MLATLSTAAFFAALVKVPLKVLADAANVSDVVNSGVFCSTCESAAKMIITGFSLSTLPNTLILGIPLLKAMYGDEPAGLLAQIVVLQSLIWYNLLLFMFEFNAAKPASEITPTSEDIEDTEGQGKEEKKRQKPEQANPRLCSFSRLWKRSWWEIKFPAIIQNSLSILASGGLGMSMISLFMASQRSRIACGIRMTAVAMVMKFMAALPPGVVPFVFAKEFEFHPDILSAGVIFGMLIALPVALIYYLVLAL